MTASMYALAATAAVLIGPFIGHAIRKIARNDGGR